jgi:flagellar biosynthesis/type III secretory pathway M-ring protein FliF/YscJ
VQPEWKVIKIVTIGFAGEFEKGSADLERMLYWRNMKVKILAIIAGLAVVGFIVLIIVQKTKSKW